jgi:hypothetical protein
MIVVVWRATYEPSKVAEALEVWKKHAAWYRKQAAVTSCVLVRPMQGRASTIIGSTTFASLAAYEESREKQAKDPEFQPLQKEFSRLDPGAERYFYQVVE